MWRQVGAALAHTAVPYQFQAASLYHFRLRVLHQLRVYVHLQDSRKPSETSISVGKPGPGQAAITRTMARSSTEPSTTTSTTSSISSTNQTSVDEGSDTRSTAATQGSHSSEFYGSEQASFSFVSSAENCEDFALLSSSGGGLRYVCCNQEAQTYCSLCLRKRLCNEHTYLGRIVSEGKISLQGVCWKCICTNPAMRIVYG